MDMKMLGMLLLAGICQGSFGLGYKDYRPFGWALFWQIYNLFCLAVAAVWAVSHVPGLWGYYGAYPRETAVILLCGVIWGLLFSACGILAITAGGIRRERETGGLKPNVQKPGDPDAVQNGGCAGKASDHGQLRRGLWFGVFSGIGSALMNLGFGYGQNMNGAMEAAGIGDAGMSAAPWMLVVFGGLLAITCHCLPCILKGHMLAGIPKRKAARTLGKLAVTSLVWYGALCLYGIFTRQAGPKGTVMGWVRFNALALMVSNLWGIAAGEWSGAKKSLRFVFAGDVLMVISWGFLAGI